MPLWRADELDIAELGEMTLAASLPIGVFDSGVGGMTVVSSIARMLPGERIFYYGDTARCPYGDRSPDEVYRYTVESLDYLVSQGVKLIVVACNTATAIALPRLKVRYSIPVIGVIQPGAQTAVRATATGRIGVIGTEVTISSNAYANEIHKLSPDADVFSLACPKFVPLVESGQLTGEAVQTVVDESLRPFFDREVDVLILGCTHYPLLRDRISAAMGSNVELISSADETARRVKHWLSEHRQLAQDETPGHRFFTTGDGSRMTRAAKALLSVQNPDVVCLDVRHLKTRV